MRRSIGRRHALSSFWSHWERLHSKKLFIGLTGVANWGHKKAMASLPLLITYPTLQLHLMCKKVPFSYTNFQISPFPSALCPPPPDKSLLRHRLVLFHDNTSLHLGSLYTLSVKRNLSLLQGDAH